MRRGFVVFGAAVLAGLAGSIPSPAAQDRFVKIYLPGNSSLTAELAVTAEERARGLMDRKALLPDQGMLFVFEEAGPHSFWMKNTLIPLDMIWLDGDRRIVHIEADVPPCRADPCPSYGPRRPALFVLELAAGSAKRLALRLFDRLEFTLPAVGRR